MASVRLGSSAMMRERSLSENEVQPAISSSVRASDASTGLRVDDAHLDAGGLDRGHWGNQRVTPK
jgi:hypothetical protein